VLFFVSGQLFRKNYSHRKKTQLRNIGKSLWFWRKNVKLLFRYYAPIRIDKTDSFVKYFTIEVRNGQPEKFMPRLEALFAGQDYIYIFEFKIDKSADEALKQIEEKQYAKPFEQDGRKLYKIGVNFSSSTRRIEGWKVAD